MADLGERAGWLTHGMSPPEIEGLEPIEVVGSGGSGTVWKCSQPRFHRWVAVKLVDTRLNKRAEALFTRECIALGGLSGHPNIVPVYAGGLDARGRPYLVMPFLESGSLADLLRRQGPVDWRTATQLIVKVSGALQVAHDTGILHRDIKPENILITQYGEPQLADFGVAQIAGVLMTATSTITATPIHAAPEVLNGRPATKSSDVYGLASSLYRLISGTPAFYGGADESLMTLLVRIATQDPVPLTQLGVPDALAHVIHRAMAKEPIDRTATAREFAEELTDTLSLAQDEKPGRAEATAVMDEPDRSWSAPPTATRSELPAKAAAADATQLFASTQAHVSTQAHEAQPAQDQATHLMRAPIPAFPGGERFKQRPLVYAVAAALIFAIASATWIVSQSSAEQKASPQAASSPRSTASVDPSLAGAQHPQPSSAATLKPSPARTEPKKTSPVAYARHGNARYGFSCAVPTTFVASPAPAAGDGFAYHSDGQANVGCAGVNNTSSGRTTSVRQAYNRALAARKSERASVTYSALVRSTYTVTGFLSDGRVYFEKTLWGRGSLNRLTWTCPLSQRERVRAAIEHSAAAFRAGDLTSPH